MGFVLLVINIYKTAHEGKPVERRVPDSFLWEPSPSTLAPPRGSWIETPSTVFLAAGSGFFFLAVFVQGIVPWRMPQDRTDRAMDAFTKKMKGEDHEVRTKKL